MQQVVVPQFLDVEDKIIGPITVRQFIELLVAGLVIVIFYKIFDFTLFVFSGLAVLAIALIVAFSKINGQPFHLFLLNFIQTMRNPKLKVWRKDSSVKDLQLKSPVEAKVATVRFRKPLSTSKISEIALIIDTGGIYAGENGNNGPAV
ncbi:MAG: PrgI family protein [Patescibacteria group bacterium]